MAQYDLLLTQNIAGAGVEYDEKIINIAKGGLLSSDASGVPTVIAGGTDGYMLVRDDTETTGLKWAVIAGGHTQNTDTGTTNNTFTIDSDNATGKIVLDVQTGGTDNSLILQNDVLDGDYTITFPNATGTVALTSDLGTMAGETATDYVAKALFDADTILAADSDDTPTALTVAEQTLIGRITGGDIDSLTHSEIMGVLWQSAPAAKDSTGTQNDIAFDDNYFYICTATDTWKRAALATNWT